MTPIPKPGATSIAVQWRMMYMHNEQMISMYNIRNGKAWKMLVGGISRTSIENINGKKKIWRVIGVFVPLAIW